MGGNQSSTRRVTVDLDHNDASTVRISTDVLARLRSESGAFSGPPRLPDTPSAPTTPPAPRTYHTPIENDEIERLEKVYKQKINHLEQLNDQLHKSSKENFNKAVEEVESKFLKQTFSPVCQEKQKLVLECYQNNPGKPLLCSEVVKDFVECVNTTRQKVLSKKG